ncbi:MAG: hypothetical protein HOD92_23235 [Deltaproteobacteria bacterium]|jgi:hypothetical protein|nr:hypothetical protein [Deltaproteobacteria bacterium]MBT4527161.1 hypothetical protein [Deltaproteobacteria bacterium]
MNQFCFTSKNKKTLLTFISIIFFVFIGINAQAQLKDQGEIIVYQTPQ